MTPTPVTSTAPLTPTAPADELVRQLYGLGALRRALLRAATDEIAANGFTALAAIHRLEPCRVSDIAQALHVDLSVASRQITTLVQAGHVHREADPADRRAHVVRLTDEGRAVLVGAHRRMVTELQHAIEDWDDAEVLELARGIGRLAGRFADRAPDATTPQEHA
jgi:DNA-binding MarR family transcriptional regulator